MNYAFPLAGLAIANLLGIISPGPAFLMVSRAAAGQSRASALGLGAGVVVAATIWAAAACFGITVVMVRFASIYRAIQFAGGAYLIWLGIGAWRDAHRLQHGNTSLAPPPPSLVPRDGFLRAIPVGAMLSLGNPKIVIFFSSIFVALLPAHAPL